MQTQASKCTDDFGDSVHSCRFTDRLLWPSQAKPVGATVPGVRFRYFMGATPEAQTAKAEADRAFHESERNCNTCKALVRQAHAKSADGFLAGKCLERPDGLRFHPEDPMHMRCYTPRWAA